MPYYFPQSFKDALDELLIELHGLLDVKDQKQIQLGKKFPENFTASSDDSHVVSKIYQTVYHIKTEILKTFQTASNKISLMGMATTDLLVLDKILISRYPIIEKRIILSDIRSSNAIYGLNSYLAIANFYDFLQRLGVGMYQFEDDAAEKKQPKSKNIIYCGLGQSHSKEYTANVRAISAYKTVNERFAYDLNRPEAAEFKEQTGSTEQFESLNSITGDIRAIEICLSSFESLKDQELFAEETLEGRAALLENYKKSVNRIPKLQENLAALKESKQYQNKKGRLFFRKQIDKNLEKLKNILAKCETLGIVVPSSLDISETRRETDSKSVSLDSSPVVSEFSPSKVDTVDQTDSPLDDTIKREEETSVTTSSASVGPCDPAPMAEEIPIAKTAPVVEAAVSISVSVAIPDSQETSQALVEPVPTVATTQEETDLSIIKTRVPIRSRDRGVARTRHRVPNVNYKDEIDKLEREVKALGPQAGKIKSGGITYAGFLELKTKLDKVTPELDKFIAIVPITDEKYNTKIQKINTLLNTWNRKAHNLQTRGEFADEEEVPSDPVIDVNQPETPDTAEHLPPPAVSDDSSSQTPSLIIDEDYFDPAKKESARLQEEQEEQRKIAEELQNKKIAEEAEKERKEQESKEIDLQIEAVQEIIKTSASIFGSSDGLTEDDFRKGNEILKSLDQKLSTLKDCKRNELVSVRSKVARWHETFKMKQEVFESKKSPTQAFTAPLKAPIPEERKDELHEENSCLPETPMPAIQPEKKGELTDEIIFKNLIQSSHAQVLKNNKNNGRLDFIFDEIPTITEIDHYSLDEQESTQEQLQKFLTELNDAKGGDQNKKALTINKIKETLEILTIKMIKKIFETKGATTANGSFLTYINKKRASRGAANIHTKIKLLEKQGQAEISSSAGQEKYFKDAAIFTIAGRENFFKDVEKELAAKTNVTATRWCSLWRRSAKTVKTYEEVLELAKNKGLVPKKRLAPSVSK